MEISNKVHLNDVHVLKESKSIIYSKFLTSDACKIVDALSGELKI